MNKTVNTKLKLYKHYKARNKKLEKFKKPISILKNSRICNCLFSDKNKIKFLNQIFRWHLKDSEFYKVDFFINDINNISECDILYLSAKIQKAGWKKLLLSLGYHLLDYKKLKRRSYSLNFTFFFLNIKDNINKEITLDIQVNNFDILNVFITTNSFYLEYFYNIINIWKKKKEEEAKKDEIDFLFDQIKNLYVFNREDYIFGYEYYFPWYMKKEDYSFKLKKKSERKFKFIIKEKKFKKIFPLKNVALALTLIDKKDVEAVNFKPFHIYLGLNIYETKKDFFWELRNQINIINSKYNIKSIPAHFSLEFGEKKKK